MLRYAEAFPGNAYVNKVMNLDGFLDKNMPCGMTIPQIYDLMLWCIRVTDAGEEAYVFLDWDRTLSCVEGLYFKSILVDDLQIPLASYMEYIMGGPPRFHVIKLLFTVFRAFGVHYFILTNNGTAAYRGGDRAYFRELIQIIDPTFVCKQILYTGHMLSKALFFRHDWLTPLSTRVPMPISLTIDELIKLRDEICRLHFLRFPSSLRQQQQEERQRDRMKTMVRPIARRPTLSSLPIVGRW
jgi:hypothetical protein